MSDHTVADRYCGCKTTTTTMTVGEPSRTVCIVVAMLLGISMVVLAYYAAEFLATL